MNKNNKNNEEYQPIKQQWVYSSIENWIENPCNNIPIQIKEKEKKKLLNLIEQGNINKFNIFLEQLNDIYGNELLAKNLVCHILPKLKNKDKEWFTRNTLGLKDYLIEPNENKIFERLYSSILFKPIQNRRLPSRNQYEIIFKWLMIGDNSPEASDRLKLAYFVCDLPSRAFLERINTTSLVEEWLTEKDNFIMLAKCLASESDEHRDFLFREELDNGWLNNNQYKYVVLLAKYYLEVFNIIDTKFDCFKEFFLANYGCNINTSVEFIQHLIQSNYSQSLNERSQKYFSYKPHQEIRLDKFLKKKYQQGFNPQEELEKSDLKKLLAEDVWEEGLSKALKALAKNDPFIKERCQKHLDPLIEERAKMRIKASCDPSEKKYGLQKSFTWVNGILIPGVYPEWRTSQK